MNLKVLLPFKIFITIPNVTSIVADTSEGAYGLLPQRIDCVAALVPGILTYQTEAGVQYIAVDEGVMIKAGPDVLVSVRNAIGGADLEQLHELVKKEFINLNESERTTRSIMAKLESGFVYNLEKFRNE